ncbi:alpha-ketoacid dehydrogenase subunit beta [Mycoplasma zalophidermidis]|uniref:Alpha-ketoacid dehydrogenase subunit beta n=1 Tax=Mycoplasma zalophidermidis TaxID=398174 RepID=A0ABS6DR41_9MOLU|nr:alpha-ketoacid dehydrogenase subunit beta [Mycoplasma zalophidermidis]MBU4689563.1 alpha-ketoacid dehydrogenase subunit beta [Mycoplasma zalophidermidis]MBU4693460.1 alpha-ketoacid dehydrogenase subunit beta [Mycoplasma zalophidermidis]MCR8966262.1 alpha-ketoacid dehydrogenase subunit beta [Mycoplasma zalophidermidis]
MEKIQVNNIAAITNALDIMMERDKSVIVYGEDAGFEGGVFRATQGLQKKYGVDRCFDAPIAESAIVGSAIGSAVAGLRPVAEIQFSGFVFYGLGQLFGNAARLRNRSRGKLSVPMVLRMPCGGGVRALEHHSESIEALFCHIPGLKVVMPATPYDSKGLLISAIEDNDPVVFLEHKHDYRAFKQEIPAGYYTVPIGKADVKAEGDDLTIVTYGHMVHETFAAIKQLAAEGKDYSIEVVDLRTLKPLDTETVVNSVKKTGRLLAISESVQSGSITAEVIARVNEKAFDDLKVAPVRLNGPDVTMPLPALEGLFMVNKDKIATVIKEILK